MSREAGEARTPAGVLRRLGAMVYDALLVMALMMIATAAFLPFTGGEAISGAGMLRHAYQIVLLVILVAFFGVPWTRSGQTLGMAAWRLQLERDDHARFTWRDVLIRLAGACLSLAPAGLGYFWIWIGRDGRAWHDRLSRSRVIVLPKLR